MKLSGFFERILVRVTLMGLVLMVASQLILTGSTTSMLDFSLPNSLDIEQAEMTLGQNFDTHSKISIVLVDYSSLGKAIVLVNGKKKADFSERRVTLKIYPGDLVEIDTTFYTYPIAFKIESNDGKAITTKEGRVITLNSERRLLD